MKHVFALMFVFVLILGPSLSIGTNPIHRNADSVKGEWTDSQDVAVLDDTGADDIDFSMMFFTETSSSENGQYYVCRRGTDTIAYFGKSSVIYISEGIMVSLEFPGSRSVIPVGESPTGSVTNYLLGNDQGSWKTNVADFSMLRYTEIYLGIDLVYKIQDGNLKYEFIVKPYADPDVIQMRYPDAERLAIDTHSLTVSMSEFSVSDTGLQTFQGDEGSEVVCSFQLIDLRTIGFDIENYDKSQVLFIDPLLVYSTYLGGGGEDVGTDISVEDGFIYITGYTESSGFPVQNANDSTFNGGYDCFVTKIAPDGQSLIYSTYLGGTGQDYGYSIDVEGGYVYITGYTSSSTFPLVNAYDSTFGVSESFLTKLTADGQSLLYSTFLGGSSSDYGYAVSVEDGYAVITGYTMSSDFPTINAYNSTFGGSPHSDCFVAKFAPNGTSLVYATYLGGVGDDAGYGASMEGGEVYLVGSTTSVNFPIANANDSSFNGATDVFVTKLTADGQSLNFSTFLGGTATDMGIDIAIENGYAYVTGYTDSLNFLTANAYRSYCAGSYDAFVSKFTQDGQSLIYSTYFGGTDYDQAKGIAVENGYAYITGRTSSTMIPLKNPYDSSPNGGYDIYIAKFAVDGQDLVYSTFYGGTTHDYGEALTVENSYVYVTGQTLSTNLPMVNSYDYLGSDDCFIAIFIDDSDMDGLSDTDELLYGTNPFCIDSDNDNYNDAYEIAQGSDPIDALSYPGATSSSDYAIAYSTYVSGSSSDQIRSVRVDDDGFIYLSGFTSSANFPMVNAWNSTFSSTRDVFIIKMSEDGQSIIYSTFIGGLYDDTLEGMAIYDGCVFVAGYTSSPNFPTYLAYDDTYGDYEDGFLFKLSSDGSSPVFSTYLGGSYLDRVYDLFVEDGYPYLTGETSSTDFPTVNAYDNATPSNSQAFLTKFAMDGQSLIYSTYLGGSSIEIGSSVAVEGGYAYVGGYTLSSDFPLYREFDDTLTNLEAFLTKFSQDGRSILLSSYIGGSMTEVMQGLAVERGFAFVTGGTTSSDFPVLNALYPTKLGGSQYSGYIIKVNTNLSTIVYSTYLTGSSIVMPNAITVERGFVSISGHTDSIDFPITSGNTASCDSSSVDAFVTKLAVDGQSLLYSTCIGGTANDYGRSVDYYSGRLFIAGYTQSDDYPCLLAYNSTSDPPDDGFLTVFDVDSDEDSLPDFSEDILGTNSLSIDSDNDNFLDAYEVAYGSDPTDPLSYPAMPQAWYDAIYEDLDGNATLIQYLIAWSDGNSSLLETVMQQLDDNATLLTQVIAWLDGNHTAIEVLFTQLHGNATLLLTTVSQLNGNATLLENLLSWSDSNYTLLMSVVDQLAANTSLLTTVIGWLDGNHTAIETLFTYLEGNATLLLNTVSALSGNSSLIQNLLTWSAGNETLLLNVIAQVDALEAADLSQVIAWLDGNHTAIETLFTYIEGNATLLLNVVNGVNANAAELDVISALITGNIAALNSLNATHIEDFDALREIIDELGISIGDTDYDGLDNLDELYYGTDLLCIDSDNDNLNDAFEIKIGTDPLDDDSDADTYLDGIEVIAGSDPLDPLSYPGSTQGMDPLVMIIAIGGIGGIAIVLVLVFFKKVRKS